MLEIGDQGRRSPILLSEEFSPTKSPSEIFIGKQSTTSYSSLLVRFRKTEKNPGGEIFCATNMGFFSFCGIRSMTINKDQVLSPSVEMSAKASQPVDSEIKSSSEDKEVADSTGSQRIPARTFTFAELLAATDNFGADCFVGEGGSGKVYKGWLESSKQVVAIKQLDLDGLQRNREFMVEVLMLNVLHHPNLVNLIGYFADGDQRLLVYEYMQLGSLDDHLLDLSPEKERLSWNTRMKIAAGVAKGMEYLHVKASPSVIFRNLKCSNILLGEGFHPKLSDFGLAKLAPVGGNTHVSTKVVGTYGYCAPEYTMTGQLTVKADIYSFGVVLLEIISGRRAIDNSRRPEEQNLVTWARSMLKDRRMFAQMVDPVLHGEYPAIGLYQALAVAAMCIQEQPLMRPSMSDVVTAFTVLASQT